jgi:HAE1 family hydrophobic/amphiphilic exporter-1
MQALEEVAAQVLPREMGYEFTGLSYQEKTAPNPVPTFILAVVLRLPAAGRALRELVAAVERAADHARRHPGRHARRVVGKFDNNVFVQIGLIMLIGLAAKNAILIVEFAKMQHDQGKDLVTAAIESARLRFRPILMTAFSFILGVVPLMLATGSGANSRRMMGVAVFSACWWPRSSAYS